ncbi:MAG TPA: DUF4446 family protein [Actinomycetota bacterium]|nr:DUF4446 family protein [Actinomycetota bacterium]
MTLSNQTLTLLVLASLGLNVLLLFLLGVSRAGRRDGGIGGAPGDGLVGAVDQHGRSLDRLTATVAELGEDQRRLAATVEGAVQHVAVVRFDAFGDMGGRLSFAAALLDARGDGVVVSAINGRTDTRVYAKAVRGGTSVHNLSEEEEIAIREAFGAARQAVKAK